MRVKLGFQTRFWAECGFRVKNKQQKHHSALRSVCRVGGAGGTRDERLGCTLSLEARMEMVGSSGWDHPGVGGGPAPAPGGNAAGARGADPEREGALANAESEPTQSSPRSPARKVARTQGHLHMAHYGFDISKFSLNAGCSEEVSVKLPQTSRIGLLQDKV